MKRVVLVLTVFSVLLNFNYAMAQSFASLEVSIKVEKTELTLGEPLVVDVTITNKGTIDMKLSYSAKNVGAVFVSKDGKNYQKFSDGMEWSARRSPRILRPGTALTSHFTVCYSVKFDNQKRQGEYVFAEQGIYFIKGGYENASGMCVYTEPIKITVKQPAGEDLEVWTKLRELEAYGRLMQLPELLPPQDALDKLTELVQKHPKSVYSVHINNALAQRSRSRRVP